MDLGVPLIDPTYVKNAVDKQHFTGLINLYGVTYNEGFYRPNGKSISPTLFIDYYGFDRGYSYEEYMQILKKPRMFYIDPNPTP